MITDVTVSFINNKTVLITNTDISSDKALQMSTLSSSGSWSANQQIDVAANTSVTLVLTDNVYRIIYYEEALVFFIYGTVLDTMKKSLSYILLNEENNLSPARYDLVSLIILSIFYLGNTTWQNVTYDNTSQIDATPEQWAAILLQNAALLQIATALEDSNKYLDQVDNTPQSTLLWK